MLLIAILISCRTAPDCTTDTATNSTTDTADTATNSTTDTADTADIDFDISHLPYDTPPAVIVEWTDTQLIVSLTGPYIPYSFGLASTAPDEDVLTWTGEDCYLDGYCHPLYNGVNVFTTGVSIDGLDPATETWFSISHYMDPSITLSYAVWSNYDTCWTWGGDYYADVCAPRVIERSGG